MKKKKHVQDFGFKYHGVTIERDGQRYQVVHKLDEVTYAVPLDSKGNAGGGIERFSA